MGEVKNKNRTPRMSEATAAMFTTLTANLHTMLPGQVVAFNSSDNTVDVKLCLKRMYEGEAVAVELPKLLHVPRGVYGDANAFVRPPCSVGSYGMVHFSERSIERWYKNGGVVDPADVRRFDLSDGVFYPMARPASSPVPSKGASTSIEMTNGNTWLELTAEGKIRLGNGSSDVLGVVDSLLSTLASATVVDPVSGALPFSPAVISAIQALQTTLAQIKA